MGFFACYLVAGLIGMPIAFLLRRNNLLNVWTIHGAALAWGMLWSFVCTVAAIYVVAAIGGDIQSLPLTVGWFIVLMVPPVVLAGTAFWLLIKKPKLT
jgi:F0F1-type ATP synthase assembly protein I